MANITVGQIIMDAQRMSSRVKELDALSSALLVEAEGNNRFVESLRQFQDDMDSLNRIANNKSNVDMVNRIQQQNANSSEILKENRELKVCLEDYERAMELIMQKYREHTSSKVLESKLNFKEVYNEKLWNIIREQREKINEMAAVMQKAANIDDDYDLELITRLRLENKTLRELLQISKQFGTQQRPIRFNEDKGVQTTFLVAEDSADELSLSGASIENANNNSVIQLNVSSTSSSLNTTATAAGGQTHSNISTVDNAALITSNSGTVGENNNVAPIPANDMNIATKTAASSAGKANTATGGVAAAAAASVTADENNTVSSTTIDVNNFNASAGMEAASMTTNTIPTTNTAAAPITATIINNINQTTTATTNNVTTTAAAT